MNQINKKVIFAVVLLVVFGAFQGTAFARLVSGKVAAIDAAKNSLELNRVNPVTGAEEKLSIAVSANTAFKGINDLAALKAGDQLWITVGERDDSTSAWPARLIEVQAQAGAASSASPATTQPVDTTAATETAQVPEAAAEETAAGPN